MPLQTSTEDTAPTSVAETLRRARALIEQPEHWTQGWFARAGTRRTSRRVAPESDKAVSFCMVGALDRINGPYQHRAVNVLSWVLAVPSIADFNDAPGRQHADVLAKFDKAIALAEQQDGAA